MKLHGIKMDKKGNFSSAVKRKFYGGNLFPSINSPEIIMTLKEIKERKMEHLIPKKLSLRDKLFNKGMKCVSYTVVNGIRVPILLEKKVKKK